MACLAAAGLDQLRIGDSSYLHLAWRNVYYAPIAAGALRVIVTVAGMERARHVSAVRTVDVAGSPAGGGGLDEGGRVEKTCRADAAGLRGLV